MSPATPPALIWAVATYLLLLWIVASAVSRGQGFLAFAAGALALALSLRAFGRGRRRAFYRLYFLTLLAALTELGLEAVLQLAPGVLTGPIANVAYTGYHWHKGGVYQLDKNLGPVLRPDVHREMYWQGHWWRHDTNADGYRGPAVDRAEAVFLGDSMIYGHGVENDETVAAQFAALTGRPAANLGQQGTCLLQALMIFERKGLRLGPRVVFVCSHPTDIEETTRCYASEQLERFLAQASVLPLVRDEWQPKPWSPIALWARYVALPLRCSAVAGAFSRSLRNGALTLRQRSGPAGRFLPSEADLKKPFLPPDATPEERLAWRVQVQAVAEIQRLAAGIGARLVVLDLGYPEAMSRAVEEMALRLSAEYSPAGRVALARAQAGEEIYLRDDGHWTPLGCRAIAEELARR